LEKLNVVTSISSSGYNSYAKENYQKFLNKWSNNIKLHIYSENTLNFDNDRLVFHALYHECPECLEFVSRNKDRKYSPPYKQKKYKKDFIKFCYKVYTICTAVKDIDSDIIIWMDSDIETINEINEKYFSTFVNNDTLLAYLNREKHPKNISLQHRLSTETGLFIINKKHIYTKEFFQRYKDYYDTDKIFFLDETHDAFVFDTVISEMEKETKGNFCKLSNGVTDRPLEFVFKKKFKHRMGYKKWQSNI